MRQVILIKLGGSVITDKAQPYTLRGEVLSRLAREIAQAQASLPDVSFVVGNGAGSFGHVPAKLYETQKGLIRENSKEGVARVRLSVGKLNQFVVEALIDAGINALSLQPAAILQSESGRISDAYFETANHFLDLGFTLVPYGDVIFDKSQGVSVASTETILNEMILQWTRLQRFVVKRVIMVSDVDGVYKNIGQRGEIFSEITNENFPVVQRALTQGPGADVTGGMIHKLESSLRFAESGVQTSIINGLEAGRLQHAILGEQTIGTTILAK